MEGRGEIGIQQKTGGGKRGLKKTLPLSKICVHAKSFQSCLILCNPMNCSPPGSSVCEILQARILEWVAMPSSSAFPTQGSNPCLLHLLHWQVGFFCFWFFTTGATWEAQQESLPKSKVSPSLDPKPYSWKSMRVHHTHKEQNNINSFYLTAALRITFSIWLKVKKLKWKSFSRVQLFVNQWIQQSMEFSSPEYWSG